MNRIRRLLPHAFAALTALAPLFARGQAPASPRPPADPVVTSSDRGRILGKENAPIWLLIVSDFQCPYCKQWHQETWHAVQKEFVETGKVRVAYVNFPLGIHPNAKPAARYAMCASSQQKFWEFADQLFTSQDQWKGLKDPTAFFNGIAEKLKLPKAAQQGCLANAGIASLVDADFSRMSRAGAASTPTFFIGKTVLEGAQPISEFRKAIAAELAAVGKR
jgi:protein-disulfide isomerase